MLCRQVAQFVDSGSVLECKLSDKQGDVSIFNVLLCFKHPSEHLTGFLNRQVAVSDPRLSS